jgi:hypothetical protein
MKKDFYGLNHWRFQLFFLLYLVVNIACTNVHQKQAIDSGTKIEDSIYRKPPSSFSDTVTVDFQAAVIFNPDSLQLEKIKTVTDKRAFESTMHNCFYQVRNSKMVLSKYYPGIKIIEVKNARYIQFKKLDGTITWIDLNNEGDQCGILIFNREKNPQLVDMTNIDTELGFYFSK